MVCDITAARGVYAGVAVGVGRGVLQGQVRRCPVRTCEANVQALGRDVTHVCQDQVCRGVKVGKTTVKGSLINLILVTACFSYGMYGKDKLIWMCSGAHICRKWHHDSARIIIYGLGLGLDIIDESRHTDDYS